MARRRLDAELVRRGLARSREAAAELVAAGRVTVGGAVATKTATQVDEAAAVVVREVEGPDPQRYVSRGALKLLGALAAFEPKGLLVAGRRALDAGASTGGFTQVLLEHGATAVLAVDVGYGQLAWELRTDERVVVLERTNVRDLAPQALPWRPSLVVGDLSFISLTLVLPALLRCVETGADLVLMVKPQFEVGRERVGPGGVVRDPLARVDAVRRITSAAASAGYGTRDVVASPLPGPRGNVEYFVWLREDAAAPEDALLERAVQEGPS